MFDVWNHGLPEISGVSRSRSKIIEQIHFVRDQDMHSLCYIPLFNREQPATWGEDIQRIVDDYNEQLNGITLLTGHTLPLYDELLLDLESGQALTLNKTRFVFITLDGADLELAANKLYHLAVAGYYPVLLYPETDKRVQRNPDLLYKFVKNGAYTMVNAMSLLQTNDKALKKCIRTLLNGNLIHMIGNYTETLLSERDERDEVTGILTKYSPEQSEQIQKNFSNLLNRSQIIIEEPLHVDKRSFSSFFSKSRA
ncbi:CpsB/CapC family capsule biosynthesis tyrosine phosphatase [Shouchella sp. 1P09AA]|uniref:CpsB/CapC family capsule biosynthesis tyrosine phosphatase n=1 Tax=unclassified Shouchella TaxID=2893065 RepID=UPI0039A1E648